MKLSRLIVLSLFLIGGAMPIGANADEVYVLIPFFGKCIKYSEFADMRDSELGREKTINKLPVPKTPRQAAELVTEENNRGSQNPDKYLTYVISAPEYLRYLFKISIEDEESADFEVWLKNNKLESEQVGYSAFQFNKESPSEYAFVTKRTCEALPEDVLKSLKQNFG